MAYVPANKRTITLETLKEALATLGVNPEERSLPITVAIWLRERQREPIMGVVVDAESVWEYDGSSQFLLQVELDVDGGREE